MAKVRSLRENRLFQTDGRALVVAMDHARRAKQVTGLVRANEIIETITAACRIASDGAADYVKAFYTGDPDSFRTLIDYCSVPVLVLGGPKTDSDRDVLMMVRDAMDAGAVGITMGRNIWGHDNVAGMTRALAAIIHDDASVDAAYGHLR